MGIPYYQLQQWAIKGEKSRSLAILTMHWSNCDHEGSSPRARPPHSTQTGQALRASQACVGWRGVQFLLFGQTCVRARSPLKQNDSRR